MLDDKTKHLPPEDFRHKTGAPFRHATSAHYGPFVEGRMPLTDPAGAVKGHRHARENVDVFDIFHMQPIELSGTDTGALPGPVCPRDGVFAAVRRPKRDDLLIKAGIEATPKGVRERAGSSALKLCGKKRPVDMCAQPLVPHRIGKG